MENLKDKCGIKGELLISLSDVRSKAAQALERAIEAARLRLDFKEVRRLLTELNSKFLVDQFSLSNIVPTAGRTALAMRLAGTTTYTSILNYGALGTNNTTPANTDTTLGTESYRKALASLTYSANIAYITQFYTASETSGTFSETGVVIDGTASANTGQLFSRALVSVTKTTSQTLTIDHTFTFS